MPEHRKDSEAWTPHLAARIRDVRTALRWLRPFVIDAWIAGMWTSGEAIDQKYGMMRMMKTLDRHLSFQYANAIHRTYAVFYFDMTIIERLNGNRIATLRYLAASLCNGGLSLTGRWRALMALFAYSVFGIRRQKRVSFRA